MALEIHDLQSLLDIDMDLLCRAVSLASGEPDPDLSVSIVDDAAIHALNREHLDHDHPTDVIAFDYGEGAEGDSIFGEVIVSAETALRVAKERGVDSAAAELILYTIHGILHLKGYSDGDPSDAAVMWEKQREIMEMLGLSGQFHP